MMQLRRFLLGDTVRHTGVALIDQILNSAVNFVVGVALVRGVVADEYGRFVLANAALLLAVGFQHAIVVMPMTALAPKRGAAERTAFVGALAATQFALWLPAGVLLAALAAAAGLLGADGGLARLAVATATVAIAVVAREFFRQAFYLFHRPALTLAVDAIHGATFLLLVALWVPAAAHPAVAAIGAAGCAALVAAAAGLAFFRRRTGGALVLDFGPLREARGLAQWGVPGMLLAWLQQQGFFYLLGGVLGTAAVATVSASRMLLMPIPMLITAIESVLRPRAAAWIGRREFGRLTRQLFALTGLAAAAASAFVVVVFAVREPLVAAVLRRPIAGLDLLLPCWGVVFLAQTLRTNVTIVLQGLERFDVLFWLTLVRATVSFALGYAGMVVLGAPGILVGLAVGEVVYVAVGAIVARGRLRAARR